MNRVQALQLLGLKVGASGQQITDAYHKQHPAAERAAAEGKPERLKRLDEAYRMLMAETDFGLKQGEGELDAKPEVDQAAFRREQARIKGNAGSGMMLWVGVLVVLGGAVAAWWLGFLPFLPKLG
jgi:hypothetical protein